LRRERPGRRRKLVPEAGIDAALRDGAGKTKLRKVFR
jgi:hypothetical protein